MLTVPSDRPSHALQSAGCGGATDHVSRRLGPTEREVAIPSDRIGPVRSGNLASRGCGELPDMINDMRVKLLPSGRQVSAGCPPRVGVYAGNLCRSQRGRWPLAVENNQIERVMRLRTIAFAASLL